MKAKSTIQRRIRELRCVIDDQLGDEFDIRLCYAVETALRWVVMDGTVGWNITRSTLEDADQLRKAARGK